MTYTNSLARKNSENLDVAKSLNANTIGFSELKIADEGLSADKEDTVKTNKFKTKIAG